MRGGRARSAGRPTRAARWLAVAAIAGLACAPGSGRAPVPEPEHRVSRPALGTLVEVVVREADARRARAAIEAAFSEIERLEALLSEWRESSELSRLNRTAGRGWVTLSRETGDALRLARALAEETDGAFDPTVLPLLRLWGFVGGPPRVPRAAEIDEALGRVGWSGLEVDPTGGRARLLQPGMAVGLGGIGKGFVAERTLAVLRRAGIRAGLVAAAGDLAFYGGTASRPWPIGIEDPRHPGKILAELERREGGVSTSAPTYRFFEAEGRRYAHLLDPRTGRPARGLASVTVVDPSAARADGLATALFVLGDHAPTYLAAHPDVRAILVAEDGARTVSPGLAVRWSKGS